MMMIMTGEEVVVAAEEQITGMEAIQIGKTNPIEEEETVLPVELLLITVRQNQKENAENVDRKVIQLKIYIFYNIFTHFLNLIPYFIFFQVIQETSAQIISNHIY